MSAKTTATMIHDNWLPNVSAETWHKTHQWTIEFTKIELFGQPLYVSKLCLTERCTCLRDDEISRIDDEPYEECCRCEQRSGSVHRRRMNTSYNDEESNFTVQCDHCFEKTEEEWADMWAEYYAGLL